MKHFCGTYGALSANSSDGVDAYNHICIDLPIHRNEKEKEKERKKEQEKYPVGTAIVPFFGKYVHTYRYWPFRLPFIADVDDIW